MNKEVAVNDYVNMVQASWTWHKLTKEERHRFMDLLILAQENKELKGTYEQRWSTLTLMYTAFLKGCGYTDGTWRE